MGGQKSVSISKKPFSDKWLVAKLPFFQTMQRIIWKNIRTPVLQYPKTNHKMEPSILKIHDKVLFLIWEYPLVLPKTTICTPYKPVIICGLNKMEYKEYDKLV